MKYDQSNPQQVIVDTDVGVDDAWALMMVLSQAQVRAITTVHGNVPVDQVTSNVCLVLDQMNCQTPVFKGAERPLMGVSKTSSSEFMGTDGLGGYSTFLPASSRSIEPQPAALALIKIARQFPGQITLLAMGPLTNLALAIRLDESFVNNVGRLVIMGGAIEGRGNASNAAEFNIFTDPEAAQIVFSAGFADVWLLPWETSLKYPLSWEDYASLKSQPSARMKFAIGIMDRLAQFLKDRLSAPGLILPDPLAAVVCLAPELVTQAPLDSLAVEISGAIGRGLTAVNWQDDFETSNKVRIVTELNQNMAFRLLKNCLHGA